MHYNRDVLTIHCPLCRLGLSLIQYCLFHSFPSIIQFSVMKLIQVKYYNKLSGVSATDPFIHTQLDFAIPPESDDVLASVLVLGH